MCALRLARSLTPAAAGGLVLALSAAAGAAQDPGGGVTGSVVSRIADVQGAPVPGVTVRLPELRLEQVTDRHGRFAFDAVPPGRYELQAEVLGCPVAAGAVQVRASEVAVLTLEVDHPAVEIPGLVVTGLGSEPSGAGVPYAVGRLDSRRIEWRPGRSIADLIRGELPGARVVQGSGLPGEEVSIQLRGPTSVSGSREPLVVVDGAVAAGGLIDLNPRDVESLTVLKGSAAAAHYGSRGQAGVIEITTRSGSTRTGAARGPLVIVDGAIAWNGLADVDPGEITGTEMVAGAAAGVLLGARAAETGLLRITTRSGSSAEEGQDVLQGCRRGPEPHPSPGGASPGSGTSQRSLTPSP